MVSFTLPIWKPVNWTSFDVVKNIRQQIKPSKVGHAGSLDPFAEGVIILCAGNNTKKIENIMNVKKEYLATIRLGVQTDTLDPTGNIIDRDSIPSFNKKNLEETLKKFIGNIYQTPPMFSALKFNGIPLYKLARKGINIHRNKRLITIYDIKLNSYGKDYLKITIICGRGTYIRSLALDIAHALGTVGYLDKLIRTRLGPYDKKISINIEDFTKWISARD